MRKPRRRVNESNLPQARKVLQEEGSMQTQSPVCNRSTSCFTVGTKPFE